jgi:hypothetical protein
LTDDDGWALAEKTETSGAPIPQDQLPIGEGLHPDGTPGAEFFVDRGLLNALEDFGPVEKYEDARFVPECISRPDAVFGGLKREGQDDALCYSVRPTGDPDDPGAETMPRYGFTFVSFVRPGIGGFVVFDWGWREEDSNFPGHPVNFENDFARRTWPTS